MRPLARERRPTGAEPALLAVPAVEEGAGLLRAGEVCKVQLVESTETAAMIALSQTLAAGFLVAGHRLLEPFPVVRPSFLDCYGQRNPNAFDTAACQPAAAGLGGDGRFGLR